MLELPATSLRSLFYLISFLSIDKIDIKNSTSVMLILAINCAIVYKYYAQQALPKGLSKAKNQLKVLTTRCNVKK